jgi:hypothetical protein
MQFVTWMNDWHNIREDSIERKYFQNEMTTVPVNTSGQELMIDLAIWIPEEEMHKAQRDGSSTRRSATGQGQSKTPGSRLSLS